MGMLIKSTMAASVALLGGCSWLSEGQYCFTEVTYECDECKDIRIEVQGEWVKNTDSKEAENPL